MKVPEWLSRIRKGAGGGGGNGGKKREDIELDTPPASSISTPVLVHSTSHLLNPAARVGGGTGNCRYSNTAASISTPVLPHSCIVRKLKKDCETHTSPPSCALSLQGWLRENQRSSESYLFCQEAAVRHSITSSNRSSNRSTTLSQSSCDSVACAPDRLLRSNSGKKSNFSSYCDSRKQDLSGSTRPKSQRLRNLLRSSSTRERTNCFSQFSNNAIVNRGSDLCHHVGSFCSDNQMFPSSHSSIKEGGENIRVKKGADNTSRYKQVSVENRINDPLWISDCVHQEKKIPGEGLRKRNSRRKDTLSSSFRFLRRPVGIQTSSMNSSKQLQHASTPSLIPKILTIRKLPSENRINHGRNRPESFDENSIGRPSRHPTELHKAVARNRSFRILKNVNACSNEQALSTPIDTSHGDKKQNFCRERGFATQSVCGKDNEKYKSEFKQQCKCTPDCYCNQCGRDQKQHNQMSIFKDEIRNINAEHCTEESDCEKSGNQVHELPSKALERKPSVRKVLETYEQLYIARRDCEKLQSRPTALYIPVEKTTIRIGEENVADIKEYLLEYDEPGRPISVTLEDPSDTIGTSPELPRKRNLSPTTTETNKLHKPCTSKKENQMNSSRQVNLQIQENLRTVQCSPFFLKYRVDNQGQQEQCFYSNPLDSKCMRQGDETQEECFEELDDNLEKIMQALEKKTKPSISREDSSDDDFVDLDKLLVDYDLPGIAACSIRSQR